jgi:hypothetical protein
MRSLPIGVYYNEMSGILNRVWGTHCAVSRPFVMGKMVVDSRRGVTTIQKSLSVLIIESSKG